MTAEQNKRSHVPAHNEDTYGNTHHGSADRIYVTQIFGSQKKRISSKGFHETATNCTEQNEPENKQDLVFSEMKKNQLDG